MHNFSQEQVCIKLHIMGVEICQKKIKTLSSLWRTSQNGCTNMPKTKKCRLIMLLTPFKF